MADTNSKLPLTSAVFHILLALSSGERHGYGIMKQVEADSQGKVIMGPGTLYGSLKRMLDAGLVKESDKRVSLGFFAIPVAAGIIAAGPIVKTLRAGGSLFAHPIHLIIVAFILSTFAMGFTTFLIDQWPCFRGVPNCD